MPQVSGLPTDPFTGPGKEFFGGTIFLEQFVLMTSEHLQRDHNYLNGIRIGEACQPGPECFVDLCLVNPTAIANKKEALTQLNADILALAETSATSMLQSEFNQAIRHTPYSMIWGVPVEDKVKTSLLRDGRPSRRGEALGTAVMTRVPFRQSRIEGDQVLKQSCRFVSCVCHVGEIEVLVIAGYFFPGRTLDAQAKNKLLLTHINDFTAKTDIPYTFGHRS